MNPAKLRWALCVLALPLLTHAQPGRWSFSGGVMQRSFETDLFVPAPEVNVLDYVNRRRGTSQDPIPFYTLGSGDLLVFSDGTLGPSSYPEDGDVEFFADSEGQLTPSTRTYYRQDEALVQIFDLNLTSPGGTSYRYGSEGNFGASRESDSGSETGVYLHSPLWMEILE
jgi:hypothetical protein